MNEKQEATSTLSSSLYWGASYLYKYRNLALKLLKNQPIRALDLSISYARDFPQFKVKLGIIAVEVLNHLNPQLIDVVQVLLSSNEGTEPDELYVAIKPKIVNTLSTSIGNYGVSLNDIGIQQHLNEAFMTNEDEALMAIEGNDLINKKVEDFMKNEVIPILFVVRDLPKFCKLIKEKGALIKDKDVLTAIKELRVKLFTQLETGIHSEIRKYLVGDQDGLYPATNEHVPALASQIKKILNALTYAERIVTFINSMDLNPDNGFRLGPLLEEKGDNKIEFLAKVIWRLAMKDTPVGNLLHFDLNLKDEELHFINEIEQVIGYVREAQKSLLEVDMPLGLIFSDELKMLRRIINFLPSWASDGTKAVLNVDTAQVAHALGDYAGKPLGVFIDQLKSHQGKTDYSFLTRHLGLLPEYLDQLTQMIYSYGTDQKGVALELTDANKEVFKDSAIKLFLELSTFDDLWSVQKGISLLFPIRKEGVVLALGAYAQTLRVHEANGEMVAHQLSRVKKELFTHLICEADKCELYLGLATGVLTAPLMIELEKLYKYLVTYAGYVITLQEKHPDLLQLDNTSFLTLRLQNTLQQKNECQLKLDHAKKALADLEVFVCQFTTEMPRDEFTTLYNSFKQYVIKYNPKLSVHIDNFLSNKDSSPKFSFPVPEENSASDLTLMSLAVQELCDKDAVTFERYSKIAYSRLVEVPTKIQGELYALDQKKPHSFLIMNELLWLVEHNALGECDINSFDASESCIEKLSLLPTESSPVLYNYHSARMLTLDYVYEKVDEFKQLLVRDLSLISKNLSALVEQYRVVQPYFVDSISANHQKEIDKLFIDLLKELSKKAPNLKIDFTIIDNMNSCLDELKNKINCEVDHSHRRLKLFEGAHYKEQEEQLVLFDNAHLTLESELVQRQNKWIPHQKLSRAVDEMKRALKDVLTQLDPCLGLLDEMQGADNRLPFPEMEVDLKALAVPEQVSWVKRLFNVIHYMGSTFKYLESLDRDISQTDVTHYFLKGPLVEGIYQIKPFVEVTKAYQTLLELWQEPAGQVFMSTLRGGYNELIGAINTIQPLYFPSSSAPDLRVQGKPESVKSSGLWYPVLALMVLPEHLTAWSANNPYQAAHAKQIQKKAKEACQYIEDISETYNAHQYFNLLFKSPYMLWYIFHELKPRWQTFCDVTHDKTIEHLQDLQSTLFKMLEEADRLELKFGLRAGLISKPTKLILDKLFNAFIEPLGMSLQLSKQLVSSTASFDSRWNLNQSKEKETKNFLACENAHFKSLEVFLVLLVVTKAKLEAGQEISDADKSAFKESYLKVYELLKLQQEHYMISLDQRDKSSELDKFCDSCLNEKSNESQSLVNHYPSIAHVMYVTKRVHAAKLGSINTLKMKMAYLTAQAKALKDAQNEFETQESKDVFEVCKSNKINEKIKLICKKLSPPVYLEAELEQYLLSKKEGLLASVASCSIDLLETTIDLELEKEYTRYMNDEDPYFRHLESILAKIGDFQSYCQKEAGTLMYERNDTLKCKTELLKALKDLAEDKGTSIKERIELIKIEAKKESFSTNLLSHNRAYEFQWNTLVRIFLDLFHSIFNFFGMRYQPQDFYRSLDKAINPKTNNGFFSRNNLLDKSQDTAEDLPDQLNKLSLPLRG